MGCSVYGSSPFDHNLVNGQGIVSCLIVFMLLVTMINLNYLTRDKLAYELVSRGVTTAGDVHMLRKIVRAVQIEGVPSRADCWSQANLEEMFEAARVKLGWVGGKRHGLAALPTGSSN